MLVLTVLSQHPLASASELRAKGRCTGRNGGWFLQGPRPSGAGRVCWAWGLTVLTRSLPTGWAEVLFLGS